MGMPRNARAAASKVNRSVNGFFTKAVYLLLRGNLGESK